MAKRRDADELIGVFEGVRYKAQDSDWLIGFVKAGSNGQAETVTITGDAPEGGLLRGVEYQFFGQWQEHAKYGRQFKFASYVQREPHSKSGVVAYLSKYCPGIGPAIANRLWDLYGTDAAKVLRLNPLVAAAECQGLSDRVAQQASDELVKMAKYEDTRIDLTTLLAGRGFLKDLPEALIQKWQLNAPQVIRHDPFRLLTHKFPRCGFATCDSLYIELGHDPARLKRQTLCIWRGINEYSNGSTWVRRERAEEFLGTHIGGAKLKPQKAIELGVRSGWLARVKGFGGDWLAIGENARSERQLRDHVLRLRTGEPNLWPAVEEIEGISDHQRDALSLALKGRVAILCGAPGTGKTWTTSALLRRMLGGGGTRGVAVCAPTGKAASRLSDVLKEHQVDLPVRTIHSTLGVDGTSDGKFVFAHNEWKPLETQLVVVDEFSMVSTALARALLSACATGTHVLIIGDVNQLPPVEHGAPLRDLMAAGLPVGELTEIRRNAGSIVRCCHEIKGHGRYRPDKYVSEADNNNLRHIPTANDLATKSTLRRLLLTIPSELDPLADVQVICSVNESSEVSRVKLNEFIRGILNPAGEPVPGTGLHIGDKVICRKNSMFPRAQKRGEAWEPADESEPVANGDMGRLVAAHNTGKVRWIVVQMDSGMPVMVTNEDRNSFTPGFAITCHKSQGSQWPIVIFIADHQGGAKRLLSKELVYTAISRAQRLCLTVGSKATLDQALRRVAIDERKTFLKELLQT